MRAAEAAAFARGSTPEKLMDQAAAGIATAVAMFFPRPGRCVVFAGKGNNAGDAFAAAALLYDLGWQIDLRLAFDEHELGELARKKLAAFHRPRRDELPHEIVGEAVSFPGLETREANSFPYRRRAEARPSVVIVLDGLLGLGAKPPLRDPVRAACREINHLRRDANAFVFAIDLPSGVDAESGETDRNCVIADFTLAIGFAKRGLVADRALDVVGRLEVIDLPELRRETLPHGIVGEAVSFPSLETREANSFPYRLRAEAPPSEIVASAASLQPLLPRREFGAYKNQFGRVGIVAGSKGLTGAAILCSFGALRAGAGLVELFVPEEIYPIVAASAAPEVMVKPIASYASLADEPIDVWGIGPGLGRAHKADVLHLLETTRQPMVVDADALNILSDQMPILARSAGPRLLTPHPGEMKRLFPKAEKSRAQTANDFCAQYQATLLLKGSRTIVAEAGQPISYNTSGNPGMATGGMGDVLTGACAALIAQKLSAYDAARLGAWLCGRAAELAIFDGTASEQSLLPSDVLDHLGAASNDLRNR